VFLADWKKCCKKSLLSGLLLMNKDKKRLERLSFTVFKCPKKQTANFFAICFPVI